MPRINTTHAHNTSASRARAVAFAGLFIALIAASAQITVPIGPVPVTLQMFAIPLAIYLLRPSVAIGAVYGYVALGALGVPVFSAGRSGMAALLGPTGGYLCGYLIAVPIACAVLFAARKAGLVRAAAPKDPLAQAEPFARRAKRMLGTSGAFFVAGVVFTAVSYVFGTTWFILMSGTPVPVALATCVSPFIIPDLIKIAFACAFANVLVPVMGQQTVPARPCAATASASSVDLDTESV